MYYAVVLLAQSENSKAMKTMKTTIYTLTILLMILISPLYAACGEPVRKSHSSNPESGIDISKYVFSVPKEADFNDSDPETIFHAINLKPVAPATATFEDAESVYKMDIPEKLMKELSPVVSKEAEFGDLYDAIPRLIRDMAPVTPTEAEFEDGF